MTTTKLTTKEVNYNVTFTEGNANIVGGFVDLTNGEIYKCIKGHYTENNLLFALSIIDNSGEDYMYKPKFFMRVPD